MTILWGLLYIIAACISSYLFVFIFLFEANLEDFTYPQIIVYEIITAAIAYGGLGLMYLAWSKLCH